VNDFLVKDKQFPLTLILQRKKHPQMMKTFYGKYFTLKQTEPKKQKPMELMVGGGSEVML
jgi:hypothetical protein